MARLRAILDGANVPPYERTSARVILQAPWCWPAAPTLQEGARQLGVAGPCAARPGDVCLVSMDDEGSSLWWLLTEPRDGRPDVRPLILSAKDSARASWRQATRDVPLYADPSLLLVTSPWDTLCAEHIASTARTPPSLVLDGTSYGLALGLGAASHLLDVPCPTDLVALAALDDRGGVTAIDLEGLSRKLRAVLEFGLGVTRVLVAPGQGAHARAAAPSLDVKEVATLRDAIALAWPDAITCARAAWTATDGGAHALDASYRIALENAGALADWGPLAETARQLGALFTDKSRVEQAVFIEQVALRHAGGTIQPMSLDRDPSLVDPGWVKRLAHAVQSYPDGGASRDGCLRAVAHGLSQLAPPERMQDADLELLGALGRAAAAAGDEARAEGWLRHAIEGWRTRSRPEDASRPACELLRLVALTDPAAARTALEATLAGVVVWLRQRGGSRLKEASRCFLALAVGRALITTGQPERGLRELASEAAPWNDAPPHVLHARLRWQALGQAALGAPAAAQAHRRELAARDPAVTAIDANAVLALIDGAFEQDEDVVALLAALRASQHAHELDRLEEARRAMGLPALAERELASAFSRSYRY